MAVKITTECDICGVIKKGVNHWWKCWILDSEFHSSHAEENESPNGSVKDVCGKRHAIEMYNRYLETGQLDKPISQPTEEED